MKTNNKFKAQELSRKEMRDLNGGGWGGIVIGVLIVGSLAALGSGFLKVVNGETPCECQNENG